MQCHVGRTDGSASALTMHGGRLQAAVDAWGERGLLELEAEERLSFACEKSPTQDSVITKLRDVFRVSSHRTALCLCKNRHTVDLSSYGDIPHMYFHKIVVGRLLCLQRAPLLQQSLVYPLDS